MRKLLLRPIALSLLWLGIGLSCKEEQQEDPIPQHVSCKDGTCCLPTNHEFEFVIQVAAEPADLVASAGNSVVTGVVLQNDFRDKLRATSKWPIRGGRLCDLSAKKVQGLSATAVPGGPFTYKYRVWGAIYTMNVPTITGEPFDFFFVDRIEKMP
jgi:hypothetical protein